MKKSFNFNIVCTLFFLFAMSLTSCKQEMTALIPVVKKPATLQISVSTEIDNSAPVFQRFLSSEAYEQVQRSFPNLSFGKSKLVKFENSNSEALVIELKEKSLRSIIQTQLIVAMPENDPTAMIPFVVQTDVQSSTVVGGQTLYSGTINTYTGLNQLITQVSVVNNSLGTLNTYGTGTLNRWTCTYAQYNAHYQYFKKACEDDAVCDFVCGWTGGGCSLSYAISAAVMCNN